jgi:hypothetical protein
MVRTVTPQSDIMNRRQASRRSPAPGFASYQDGVDPLRRARSRAAPIERHEHRVHCPWRAEREVAEVFATQDARR